MEGCSKGGAESCAEEIGAGEGDVDQIAGDEWLEGLRKVNSS